MVTLEKLHPPHSQPMLGEECRFILRGESIVSGNFFLEQDGIFYSQPLRAGVDGSVRLYPESPGRYALHAAWRSDQGDTGWARAEFRIQADRRPFEPRQVTMDDRTELWVPTAWDARAISSHERDVFRELKKIIRPGATVYDIGANVGLFSVRLATWVGTQGWLYAVEPNPICVYFLRANLERALVEHFTILPVAVSSGPGECLFTVNYGSSLIGVDGDSPYAGKPGHQIRLPGESLDNLIQSLHLRKPDFIKLDVEGAEGTAVAGMTKTLETCRPTFMIELHGREAAARTLGVLGDFDYRYLVASTGATFATAQALLDSLPEACVQVVGFPQTR